ncbi:MAG: BamA/TamA family outer membrane protein [Chitinophagaceae bacterium]|nr:BamA/TamA family outer membrane protein [Chitinophagaceae bacterium]
MFVASCTVPRKFQEGKPFIYNSSVVLENTDLNKSKRRELKEALINQMDDSLKVRTVLAVDWHFPPIFNRLSKPAVFDTLYIGKSKTFMRALLKSEGYFEPTIKDEYRIDSVKTKKKEKMQQRVTVKFTVSPGRALKFDSIGYDLTTPELQQLALANKNKALIKKNNNYSIQNISNELDRLITIYRNNGYYKINKEDLYAEHDTVVAALIDPGLDPFEQFELLDSLSKRKREPTINIVFKQRVPKDSSHLDKYYWGNINVYPDRPLLDTAARIIDTVKLRGYNIYPVSNKFKIPFIARNIAMKPGTLYKQSDYFKTINTFTNFGAWAQVDINLQERLDSIRLLNADVLLYPAKKQSLTVDLEASRNTTDLLTTGSLFGIGLNLGVRNRNGFRESIGNSTNLRFGVELGPSIVQTAQTSLSHSIYFPRFLTPFFKIKHDETVTPRTIINLNASYTNRRDFVEVRSINASFGYGWTKKNHAWQYIPLNIEYTSTYKTDSFLTLEKTVPSIAQVFNNGLIISQIGTYTTGKTNGQRAWYFRSRLEESGALFGLIKNLERGDLRRFLKLDAEYKYFVNNPKSTWAFRFFGGYGYAYGKTGDQPEYNLPFFKAFFGGGPYSMRAWAVRRLGLGSSSYYDTVNNGVAIDRWGDFQLEGNIEYRFDLGTLFGIKLESAIFTDMGNVWSKTFDSQLNRIDSASFKLSRLYTDLAVGAGTSLRFDFDFFLIRLDWAYKIKNPVYARENDGWFHKLQIYNGQFQLGIGYPF